ncbi:hypothetical protein MYCTH_109914 [Thermothelomyces thermophilus ATCC 42464]|uniref:Uncharacterized protein n=1 Tax=Thermothelomyces thermophilus (strain ATCC 42464 / BCRC 31852 / DSM 1799) TaxID=573729 RepID=G2QL20_THET4|nr:uncharacterized protein MYCTH_109914 [Thermothelomyces thermophilus ATCC 42464]AEO60652.1 hypothetical protein MYCTH_109914 [Thermothelomyces thermophilus ATCC 42464]
MRLGLLSASDQSGGNKPVAKEHPCPGSAPADRCSQTERTLAARPSPLLPSRSRHGRILSPWTLAALWRPPAPSDTARPLCAKHSRVPTASTLRHQRRRRKKRKRANI